MLPAPLRFALRCAGALTLFASALAAHGGELLVSGASSLANVFREIAPAFESRPGGTRLLFNFAASDTLLAQISKGAPVDVFAAADDLVMDRAEQLRLIQPGSRRNVVGNAMVLITPRDSRLKLEKLADLLSPAVTHVAMGRPESVPAGRYARAALAEAGLWQAVEGKAVFAQNVRQGLDYVARGEAAAGLVYASDAALMKDKVVVAFRVPTPLAINYPVAVVAGSTQAALAQRFIDYLGSPEAQAAFARHGFVVKR